MLDLSAVLFAAALAGAAAEAPLLREAPSQRALSAPFERALSAPLERALSAPGATILAARMRAPARVRPGATPKPSFSRPKGRVGKPPVAAGKPKKPRIPRPWPPAPKTPTKPTKPAKGDPPPTPGPRPKGPFFTPPGI
ncbi:MAG: hypothetical protein AAFU61_05370 [Pseudomonadota bacterium]